MLFLANRAAIEPIEILDLWGLHFLDLCGLDCLEVEGAFLSTPCSHVADEVQGLYFLRSFGENRKTKQHIKNQLEPQLGHRTSARTIIEHPKFGFGR